MLFHHLGQEFRINTDLVRHKGSSEARAKCSLRFLNTNLSASKLGGKALDKVIHD